MNQIFVLLLVLISGAGVSIQSGVNGELGRRIGTIEGAFISFLIGLIVITLLVFFLGNGQLTDVFHVPKWTLWGGVLGAIFIISNVFAVPKLGVGITVITVIVGQSLMSLVIDHFGWFGRQPVPFNWQRVLGVALLFLALYLIYRSGNTSASSHTQTKGEPPHDSIVTAVPIEKSLGQK